jgi:hypothetical protein
MTSVKWVSGVMIFLFLTASLFANISHAALKESQVVITPGNENGTILNISVLAFEPAESTTGRTSREVVEQWYTECKDKPDVQTCMFNKSLEYYAASKEYQVAFTSLENATILVEYYDPLAGSLYSRYLPVPECEELKTNEKRRYYSTNPDTGELDQVSYYYYTQCDISDVVGGRKRTYIRAMYLPAPDEDIVSSETYYTFNNPQVTTAGAFTAQLNSTFRLLSNLAQGGGKDFIPIGTALPCVGAFFIAGLLLASMYFAGKSPITLLDITTPRLPAPKGVTAGGQILTPFGYGEMSRTAKGKMKAAAAAIGVTATVMGRKMAGDPVGERLRRKTKGLTDPEGKAVADGLIAGGRSLGMKGKELESLAKLPYHYTSEDYRKVEQILEALERRGGRERLMAMQIKDYLLGLRTSQSLDVLSGHPDIALKGRMYGKISKTMDMAFGSNRYAVLGPMVGSVRASLVRTGRVVGRMTKAVGKEAPGVARGVTKTTMEMLGGKRAMEDLKYKGRKSPTAAWLHKQLTEHPSRMVIGQSFPINEKMGHLYNALHDEAMKGGSMAYLIKQIYKKLGINFNISEQELSQMGHLDLDILKRSGYTASAELLSADKEIRRILSSSINSQQKLDKLIQLANVHGAIIDQQMHMFNDKLQAIHTSAQPDHIKLIMLQGLLEEQNRARASAMKGGYASDDAFHCPVGGDSVRGSSIWETMVLRTMIWDGENGHLKGGLKEELISARLNVANRLASLDPTTAMEQLPEHMRNPAQLKAVAKRNREDLISLFTEDGKRLFEQTKGKSIQSASISEVVEFMYGGPMKKSAHIDKETGKMVWWGADEELSLPKGSTLVDVKRHWYDKLSAQENYAIGQWVESRFTKSYVPAYKASIEAALDRTPGSAGWSIEQRTQAAKKHWVADQLLQDMEQRFNSHFGQNTYGTTRETTRFYGGIMAGFMEKTLQEKGLSANHLDMRFIKEMDPSNPKHLSKLGEMMKTYRHEFDQVVNRPFTYDDIAKANKAVVMLHEGGFAYYKKGMMLSDMDRVMAGEVALKDNKGQLRKFIPEDIPIQFAGRDDLSREFHRVRHSGNPNDWTNFIESARKWTKEGGYNYNREKVFAATLWQYASSTYDYSRFWRESSISIEGKRQVTPAAPSPMRFFGAEGHKFTTMYKPFRDMGLHMMDYVSKVALAAGGPAIKTSYDITPVSEHYRQHSMRMATTIMSGRDMDKLTPEERVAYRNAAMQHHAYHQVWDYVVDRNPMRTSTSFGTYQGWSAGFHFGPSQNFSVKHNLRAYMDRGEYANFMSLYGFPMNVAGKIMRPYTNMVRGMQMSMMGYASKWDSTPNALRQWNYTEPRLREAMQSMNPFSFRWFPGKTSERISKLNVFGGSLEKHQLAGPEFSAGLKQAPQDLFLNRKGIYSNIRTGEANPGASFYNYRHELKFEAPMAEYLYRQKEAVYMHDRKLREDAMTNTVRRTVSAEALAIRRDQELRGFGVMQNPLYGWANPIAFMWHMPVPLYPTSATPRDIISKWVGRSKGYGGEGFSDSMRRVSESMGRGTKRFFQPHMVHRIVYCPRCYAANYRGSRCRCGQVQY